MKTESAYFFRTVGFIFREEFCSGRNEEKMMRSLTLRYGAIQFTYWAATAAMSALRCSSPLYQAQR